jgi:hypothetical protein
VDEIDLPRLEWRHVRGLPAFLLLCMLPLAGVAQNHEFFPRDDTFRALLADPAEPRVFMSRLRVKRDAGDGSAAAFSAAFLGVGVDFGLLRRSGAAPGEGWQLGVFGSADSLFNLDLPGDALMNGDYRFGFPVTWRSGLFSMRARLYHQSSHLGDELILGGNAPQRTTLSFETLDFIIAWEYAGLRLYGGAGHVLRSSHDSYDGTGVHAGFDYVSRPALSGMRFVAGLDVKWIEQVDWHSGVSAKAGIKIGRHSLERRGLTLLLEAYDGFAPFGQFFVEEWRYRGVSLQFDF